MAANAVVVTTKMVHIEASFQDGQKVKLEWPVRDARAIAHEILRATENGV